MRKTRDKVFICVPDVAPLADVASKCPNRDNHTPAPYGYLGWHEWAAQMTKTHRQIRCHGCGLLAIWVRRLRPGSANAAAP